MRLKMGIAGLLVLFVTPPPAYAQDSEAIVLDQPQAPLQILSYDANFDRGGKYSREGIKHEVQYQNRSSREIVAVRIGLVSFDIWNEFLDRTGGLDMDDLSPDKSGKGTWVATAYGDFSFHTGVAYVSRVRFSDGQIWKADLDQIAAQLGMIEEGFDVSRLEKKDDG